MEVLLRTFLVAASLDLQDQAFPLPVPAYCLQVLLVVAFRDLQASQVPRDRDRDPFPEVSSLVACSDCQEASARPC